MTLIDTSGWIQFFRRKGCVEIKSHVSKLLSLNQAAYTCPVRYELFFGAKREEKKDLEIGLSFATRLALQSEHWDEAAEIGCRLRLQGFTFPAADVLIAVVACQASIPILSCDQHFVTIQQQGLPQLQVQDFS